ESSRVNATVSPSPSTERGPGGEVKPPPTETSALLQQPSASAESHKQHDTSGQNVTNFPDAEGLSCSDGQNENGENRENGQTVPASFKPPARRPSPTSDPRDLPYPETPTEFEAEAREFDQMAKEASAQGNS